MDSSNYWKFGIPLWWHLRLRRVMDSCENFRICLLSRWIFLSFMFVLRGFQKVLFIFFCFFKSTSGYADWIALVDIHVYYICKFDLCMNLILHNTPLRDHMIPLCLLMLLLKDVHSCFWVRLLAREGINAEQLARDLKSFELKVSISLDHICNVYLLFRIYDTEMLLYG